jgi:formyltetrahydrofolate synthetase
LSVFDERSKRIVVIVDIDGTVADTEEDFRRFHLFAWTVGKLVRYSQNWSSGGHGDSLHDAIVYMAILGTEDENLKKETEDEGVDF